MQSERAVSGQGITTEGVMGGGYGPEAWMKLLGPVHYVGHRFPFLRVPEEHLAGVEDRQRVDFWFPRVPGFARGVVVLVIPPAGDNMSVVVNGRRLPRGTWNVEEARRKSYLLRQHGYGVIVYSRGGDSVIPADIVEKAMAELTATEQVPDEPVKRPDVGAAVVSRDKDGFLPA